MNKKLLITAVVIAVVAVGYYFYANGFSFSQSDAAGYGDGVTLKHVSGPQVITDGQTIEIQIPRGVVSRNKPATISIEFWNSETPLEFENQLEPDETGIIGQNVTSRTFRWTVDLDNWKGGMPTNKFTQIRVHARSE